MYSEAPQQQNPTRKAKKLLNSDHMGSFVDVGDWKIHYYEQGEGTPLLLVHGIGQSLFTWHRVIDELSDYFRVIAIDLPGHGYSSKPLDADYSIENLSELLVSTMDAIGIQTADAMAFGTGAIFLLRSAQKHVDRFGRIVLETPGGITPTVPFFVRALNTPLFSWLYKILLSPRVVRNILNDCFFDQTLVDDTMVNEYYTPISDSLGRSPVVTALQSFEEDDTMQSLREMQNEICMVWGADDRWHDLEIADQFNVSLKNGQLFIIRNCGHIIHEEKWDRLLELIIPFLQGKAISYEQF